MNGLIAKKCAAGCGKSIKFGRFCYRCGHYFSNHRSVHPEFRDDELIKLTKLSVKKLKERLKERQTNEINNTV